MFINPEQDTFSTPGNYLVCDYLDFNQQMRVQQPILEMFPHI